jgi:hypothetical protein
MGLGRLCATPRRIWSRAPGGPRLYFEEVGKFAETLTRAADANLLVLLGFTEGLSGYEPCKDASDGRESREHDLIMSLVNSVAEPV